MLANKHHDAALGDGSYVVNAHTSPGFGSVGGLPTVKPMTLTVFVVIVTGSFMGSLGPYPPATSLWQFWHLGI